MSITGVTQYDDGLGECSALDAIAASGVTTGRLSNFAQATVNGFQTYSVTQNFSTSSLVYAFTPTANSNSSWVYAQVRVTSSSPLANGEYIEIRSTYASYELKYQIYPAPGYQNGPYLRSFRFGKVDFAVSFTNAEVYVAISSGISRNLEVKLYYIQTL